MSQPDTLRGTYIDIMVEEPALSGSFTRICGLSTKQFAYAKNSSDIQIPDCDDPEDVPIRRLNITGRQWSVSGEGVYNRAQAGLIRTLVSEGAPRVFRFAIAEPSTESIDAGYWQGPAQIMNVAYGGPAGGELATLSMSIESDGEWVWIDA